MGRWDALGAMVPAIAGSKKRGDLSDCMINRGIRAEQGTSSSLGLGHGLSGTGNSPAPTKARAGFEAGAVCFGQGKIPGPSGNTRRS